MHEISSNVTISRQQSNVRRRPGAFTVKFEQIFLMLSFLTLIKRKLAGLWTHKSPLTLYVRGMFGNLGHMTTG